MTRATPGRDKDGVPPDRLLGETLGTSWGAERMVTAADAGLWKPTAPLAVMVARCICQHGAQAWVGLSDRCCIEGHAEMTP